MASNDVPLMEDLPPMSVEQAKHILLDVLGYLEINWDALDILHDRLAEYLGNDSEQGLEGLTINYVRQAIHIIEEQYLGNDSEEGLQGITFNQVRQAIHIIEEQLPSPKVILVTSDIASALKEISEAREAYQKAEAAQTEAHEAFKADGRYDGRTRVYKQYEAARGAAADASWRLLNARLHLADLIEFAAAE